jgi:hypothetical protein
MNLGGNGLVRNSQRLTSTTDGLITYNGTKDIYVNIVITVTYDKQGGGSDDYDFFIYKNGSVLAGSISSVEDVANVKGVLPLNYSTSLSNGDTIALWIENPASNDDMRITDIQMSISE